MADALVSNVADLLFNIMKDQYQDLRSAVGVEKKIQSLSTKLSQIREVLDDAEKRSFNESGVKIWLQKLQHFSYDADDVLDQWITKFLIRQAKKSWLSFKNLGVNRDIAKKIKKLDSRLDQIMKEKDQFNFLSAYASSRPDQEPKRVPTTSFVDASEVHGRRDVADAVIKQLIEDAGDQEKNGPLVISIVGTGGIGKTTLAQLVYGDHEIEKRFEIMMWICVSQPFNEINIAKAIVESITEKSPELSQLETLLKKIRSSLSNKKFLLVLDDVWTEEDADWNPFRIALKAGLPGSRILVTTRSEGVARMMRTVRLHKLDPISDEDSWLLFSRMAFSGRSEEDCRELNDIGKNIVQKCKGLPLAVKVMGSLLQLKDTEEEWQNVLDSKIWELKIAETELFPHLYLSYDDLTPTTKRCLLYCAIFPKDDIMKAKTLIRMWMAQGYLTTTNGSNHNQMELKGQEIFRNLAMRSFFQDLGKDFYNSNIIKSCKMHDIVHDFVQFLTKNECYSTDWLEDKIKLENLRHLSCQYTEESTSLASIHGIGKVRSFMANDLSPEITPKLFNGLKSVRVLELHGSRFKEIPKEIGNLLHLRYIDLSDCRLVKELPDAICSLYNLQTLDLRECWDLSRLPKGIGNLINLRHLKLRGCNNLEMLPQGIAKLTQLRALRKFVVGKACCELGDLEKLNQLQGYLKIVFRSHLNTTRDVEEAKKAGLRNKEHLNELALEFDRDIKVSIDVMEALKPPLKLQDLTIDGYGGTQFPSWITRSLDNLQFLGIESNCTSLPPLGKLPSLESLTIWNMKSLKRVGSEFLGVPEVAVAFPKLKKLDFRDCEEWEEWDGLREATNVMPCLTELFLSNCSKLKSMPPLGKLPSLESLTIWNMKSLKRVGSEFLGVPEVAVAFPKLKTLEFSSCEEWEEWDGLREATIVMPCLTELTLEHCSKLKTMPPLGKLPSLESLSIRDMKSLKRVGSEFLGVLEVAVAFPKLKKLEFSYCSEWKEWDGLREEEEEGEATNVMPCLTLLTLWNCSKLKTVPFHLLGKMSALQSLTIYKCPNLEVDESELSHIPRVDITD